MATNNNKSTGNIRAPQGANQNKGINAALDQAGYRREFNERVFSDTGYIQSSIKGLQEQVKEIEKVLNKSKDLTKAETNRYNTALANMKKLEAQLNQMYKSQDVSTKELFDTLNESVKLRQKSVDELYKHYMDKEKELDGAGKEFIDKKIDYFAAKTRELKGAAEDINEASDKFNKSQKTFSEGVDETLNKVQKGLGEFSKILNVQAIATNSFLEKANERYDIINQLNQSLGYGTEQATAAYNSATNTFAQLNKKVDNLYSVSDMKQYLQDSQNYGLLNQEALEKNLDATLNAQKYLGATSDTLSALYRYSRLTNNNDTINRYNKTMIALQKEGIGINKDMLNNMIQQNIEVSDVLSAAGLSGETLEQFNSERDILNAQIQDKYGAEYASQINNLINESIKKLATPEGNAQLAQMGINPATFTSILSSGDASKLYDYAIESVQGMANNWSGDIRSNMIYQNQLGMNYGDINAARKLGANGIDDLGPVTEETKKIMEDMKESDVNQYVKENIAMSEITKAANGMETWLQKTFGNSDWLNFESLGTAAFTAYLASSALNVGKSILSGGAKLINYLTGGKLAGSLATAFGGKFSGIANKFFGKGSDLVKSTGAIDGQMSLFNTGKSVTGKVLSGITTAAGGIALGLSAANVIKGAIESAATETETENKEAAKNQLKGTALEGNSTAESITGIGTTYADENNNFMNELGSGWSTTTRGIGVGLLGWTRSLADINKDDWSFVREQMNMRKMTPKEVEAYTTAFALLLMSAGRQSDVDEFANYTSEELAPILKSKGWSKDYLNRVADDLAAKPNKSKDENQEYIDWDKLKIDGYHKAGLDRVPRDNYRTLLHKNEMVLNENEAEEYKHNFEALRGLKKNNNVLLLPSNSTRGIGGTIGGVEVGDYNSSYVNGHNGIDLYFSNIGTPVGAAIGGNVITSKDIPANFGDGKSYHGKDTSGKAYSSYGRYVEVKGDDGERYIYAHLNERVAQAGDRVEAGTLLGYSGTTGNSSGPHLHFEVRGKGNSSANHAKYYTNYVRSASGTPTAGTGNTSSTSGNSSEGEGNKHITLAAPTTTSRRAIPGIGGNDLTPSKENQINGIDRIVNSVDGVSTKIIRYLDEIRQEQEAQRSLIRAFSTSQNMIDMRN